MFQKDTLGDVLVMSVGAHCFQAGFRRIEGIGRIGDNEFLYQYQVNVEMIHMICASMPISNILDGCNFFEFYWIEIFRI